MMYFYVCNWPLFVFLIGAYKKYLIYTILLNYVWYTASNTWKVSHIKFLEDTGIDYNKALFDTWEHCKLIYNEYFPELAVAICLFAKFFDIRDVIEFYDEKMNEFCYNCVTWDGSWCLIRLNRVCQNYILLLI